MKEQPKRDAVGFRKAKDGDICLKPVVQLVFEIPCGVCSREFCFIVGRGKRATEDHFTPDFSYISKLDPRGKDGPATDLEAFYKMVSESSVVWVSRDPRF